jgi:hypothetical protein
MSVLLLALGHDRLVSSDYFILSNDLDSCFRQNDGGLGSED